MEGLLNVYQETAPLIKIPIETEYETNKNKTPLVVFTSNEENPNKYKFKLIFTDNIPRNPIPIKNNTTEFDTHGPIYSGAGSNVINHFKDLGSGKINPSEDYKDLNKGYNVNGPMFGGNSTIVNNSNNDSKIDKPVSNPVFNPNGPMFGGG